MHHANINMFNIIKQKAYYSRSQRTHVLAKQITCSI